jgi:hypothetical protein
LVRSEWECPHTGKSIPGKPVDEQLDRVFRSFQLSPDWKEWIVERLNQRDNATQRRISLEARLVRIRNIYLDGDISKESYDRTNREIQEQMASLTVPEISISVIAGELLENIG